MSKPMNQMEVESLMFKLIDDLEKATDDFAILAKDAAEKEAKYKHRWAKEYLGAEGAVKQREAWTDYKLEEEAYDYKVSEALAKAKLQKLNSLRAQMDMLRTIAANVRHQTS